MTKLEQVEWWDNVEGDLSIDREEALAAARLDCEAARAEGYRQGVEDGRLCAFLSLADEKQDQAWAEHKEAPDGPCLIHAIAARRLRDAAFRGASGIRRVEIRQRLERLNEEQKARG